MPADTASPEPEHEAKRRGRRPSPWPPELIEAMALHLMLGAKYQTAPDHIKEAVARQVYLSRLDGGADRAARAIENLGGEAALRQNARIYLPLATAFMTAAAALNILDTNAATNWKPPA